MSRYVKIRRALIRIKTTKEQFIIGKNELNLIGAEYSGGLMFYFDGKKKKGYIQYESEPDEYSFIPILYKSDYYMFSSPMLMERMEEVFPNHFRNTNEMVYFEILDKKDKRGRYEIVPAKL